MSIAQYAWVKPFFSVLASWSLPSVSNRRSSDAYGGLRQPIAQPQPYQRLRQRVREGQKPFLETLHVACFHEVVRLRLLCACLNRYISLT
ncbi:MAG: hypothetical protein V7L29_21365 [Nostoc sp.]